MVILHLVCNLNLMDSSMFLVAVGRRIKALRVAENISQSDLSLAVGMSQSQLSDIERGARSLRIEQLRAIAFMLRSSMAYLLVE